MRYTIYTMLFITSLILVTLIIFHDAQVRPSLSNHEAIKNYNNLYNGLQAGTIDKDCMNKCRQDIYHCTVKCEK